MKHTLRNALLLSFTLLLTGCAGLLPLPGGKDTVNHTFYENDTDLKERILALEEGMERDDVFAQLERNEDDFILLNRQDIVATLYGGQQISPIQTVGAQMFDQKTLRSLTGYKLIYRKVHRKHGVSSPIAMRTNETGYSYTATLIFKNGALYEKPVLAGGAVDTSSTKTLFDYLTPRTLMSQAGI